MPSVVVHVAVASKVNKYFNRNYDEYIVGAIAPDVSKLVGDLRNRSHFVDSDYGYPNVDKFLLKYLHYLSDDFVLGYYVHLYTDYLFEKYFCSEFLNENQDVITKLDGTKVKGEMKVIKQYMYNDYTNLNNLVIKKYKLDFSFLDKPFNYNKDIISEVPITKLDVLFKTTKDIIDNSTDKKEMIFSAKNIYRFIDFSTLLIISNLKSLGLKPNL